MLALFISGCMSMCVGYIDEFERQAKDFWSQTLALSKNMDRYIPIRVYIM